MEDKVEFVIKNLNREKIFKEIIKTTHIYDVKINDGEIFFTIKRKDAKKVEKILEKKYIKINNKREKGIFIFFKKKCSKNWNFNTHFFIFNIYIYS